MNDEDEILKHLMTKDGQNYIMDDGFTRGVIAALPKGRNYASPLRRTLLIGTAALAGCAVALAHCAPSLFTFAEHLGKAHGWSLPTDGISVSLYLTVSLAFASALGAYCVKNSGN